LHFGIIPNYNSKADSVIRTNDPILMHFVCTNPVSVKFLANPEIEKVIVYPNPAHTEIKIKNLPYQKNVEILIYNSLGIKVAQNLIADTEKTINIEQLASGTYLIKFEINKLPYSAWFSVK